MINPIIHTFQYGLHTVTLETGMIARQATSSVMVTMNDTSVLVTVVAQKKISQDLEKNFFPLTINYQERTYAAGRIPGGFFRREGRPSENEILIGRLIDRPIRPLFPPGFLYEVQIIATVVSVNPQINPDIVAMIGVSAALSISGLPFNGPIGAARIGYINNKYILNPSVNNIKNSTLDLIVSGTKEAILMVEAEANILTESEILNAIIFGHNAQQDLIKNIHSFINKVTICAFEYQLVPQYNLILYQKIKEKYKKRILDTYEITNKKNRNIRLEEIKKDIITDFIQDENDYSIFEIENIMCIIQKNTIRNRLMQGYLRLDGREKNIVRKLDIRTGILPRTHGSSLFTRGDTQALVSVTLGTARDAQNLDELLGDRTDNFIFHYNFPPYSVGETGIVGSPKRREIGHGKLAKRSLLAVMPTINDFPYTVRIVSEITESNGSSSMASVCGASLALMDAGVPIKSSIAGIAMGLIKENNKYIILTDILGEEDHLGDMDFKVSGTDMGITALQMDIKIEGITSKIIQIALDHAKQARLHILQAMKESISSPRSAISEFAPRIYIIKINPEKIKDVIGKGGSIIRMLTEETGTIIEIEDDGTIKISSSIEEKANHAIRRIKELTAEIEIGKMYTGRITRIVDFGAFVSIGSGKEGLVHISQIAEKRVNKVTDFLKLNQIVSVKVLELDRQGRIRLSIKEAKKSS
ncbi:Polyribonucleotide nucleotidyltransferase [Buchnera aphidicola (Thelaxes suberi)]|uniref:polyribonucleotide nucleotidyltransferase n=1 Tax=Buchnera aphidicola TaxID=9 RepID=UPI003463CB06